MSELIHEFTARRATILALRCGSGEDHPSGPMPHFSTMWGALRGANVAEMEYAAQKVGWIVDHKVICPKCAKKHKV